MIVDKIASAVFNDIVSGLSGYNATINLSLEQLKDEIEWLQSRKESLKEYGIYNIYSLSDYCDKRKSTDLTRFNYCPLCGKKIDWKAIKGDANG